MAEVQESNAGAVPPGPEELPPSSPAAARSRADRRRTRQHLLLLAAVLVCCLTYVAYQLVYYDWVLRGPTMNIEVICQTGPLQANDLRVTVYYDKLALSPLARVLGLYQDRQPDRVGVFHGCRLRPEQVRVTSGALSLRDVPQGPAVKVLCRAGERNYFVDVTDRSLKNGTLFVYANGAAPAGSR